MTAEPPPLAADFFDGRSARSRRALVRVRDGRLLIEFEGERREEPLRSIQWSEYQRHGSRQATLADGATLAAIDVAAWDAFQQAIGHREPFAVRASRSWRAALLACVGIVAVAVAVWVWALPKAADVAAGWVPASIERSIGDEVMATLSQELLRPSRLPAAEQARIEQAFRAVVAQAFPAGDAPDWRLAFRQSRIGPNAFALPGGQIVMTDELVQMVAPAGADAEPMLIGVLAHELGHVRYRHGLRGVARATAASLFATVLVGDASSLLAIAPVMLLQQGYSRDFERESDAESVRILRAAGLSPAVMATFFERLEQRRQGKEGNDKAAREPSGLEIALSSHPADAERIRYFRDAAAVDRQR